ncbi:MAG: CDC48 family AAA ATPase [Candidatus Aenigmarchaeota archaeon]|nr:CDC48 family AAA ATPase [Candidatus Aenigmarchaeota archaeon]
MAEEVKLKVGELTNREEFGKGIARLGTSFMQKIGVREGGYIQLEGAKKTYSIAVRSYPSDIGLDVVRIDGISRKNCNTGVGETVSVKKASIKEAQKITLAPAQEGMMIHVDPDYMKQNLFKRPFAKGDIVVPNPVSKRRQSQEDIFDEDLPELFKTMLAPFGEMREIRLDNLFGGMKFIVVDVSPKEGGYIGETTELEVLSKAVEIKEEQIPEVTYDNVGGLKEEINAVREVIELPMRHPELFQRLGIKPPKGVLMHGPPGTGKTLLAKALANESGANFYSIAGPEIMSKYYGQSEENLRKKFDEAEKNAPSIIFIDEIDAIAPKREEVTNEVERRVVSQLLTMMDGLKSRGQVIVIGATNRPDSLDPALRRPGRFDREIVIGVPNQEGRLEILQIHSRNMPLAEDVDLKSISEKTYGFVGADLEALCKEAAMHALRRVVPDLSMLKGQETLPKETIEKLMVTQKDFEDAMKKVEPSAMREVLVEVPNVHWSDIGGLEGVKQQLVEVVEWPLKYSEKFGQLNIKPPRGVLLYGPPGTGKTMLAKAVANESGANFITVKGPELLSKWVGESEKKLREIFKKAKQAAPSVIFFDEIDAMTKTRGGSSAGRSDVVDSIVSQLLTELSGIEELKGVVVMAATNRPDLIDSSLMRPGRFDRHILVPNPDKAARLQILKIHSKGVPLDKDVNLEDIAEKANGYSGADLEALVREAAILVLRDSIKDNKDVKKVSKKEFEKVMKTVRPSVPEKLSKWYEDFEKTIKTPDEEKKKASTPEYTN